MSQVLRELVDERIRGAGIGPDDPGLARIRAWNAQVPDGYPLLGSCGWLTCPVHGAGGLPGQALGLSRR